MIFMESCTVGHKICHPYCTVMLKLHIHVTMLHYYQSPSLSICPVKHSMRKRQELDINYPRFKEVTREKYSKLGDKLIVIFS